MLSMTSTFAMFPRAQNPATNLRENCQVRCLKRRRSRKQARSLGLRIPTQQLDFATTAPLFRARYIASLWNRSPHSPFPRRTSASPDRAGYCCPRPALFHSTAPGSNSLSVAGLPERSRKYTRGKPRFGQITLSSGGTGEPGQDYFAECVGEDELGDRTAVGDDQRHGRQVATALPCPGAVWAA